MLDACGGPFAQQFGDLSHPYTGCELTNRYPLYRGQAGGPLVAAASTDKS